jgi:hypothetical protein
LVLDEVGAVEVLASTVAEGTIEVIESVSRGMLAGRLQYEERRMRGCGCGEGREGEGDRDAILNDESQLLL